MNDGGIFRDTWSINVFERSILRIYILKACWYNYSERSAGFVPSPEIRYLWNFCDTILSFTIYMSHNIYLFIFNLSGSKGLLIKNNVKTVW